MLQENEYVSRDALGLADLVRSKSVKPEELLEVAIRRAERINPAVNAIVTPMYDFARRQIADIKGDEIFAGVPFLLKDLRASYKGVRTTGGSAWMAGTPDFDSEVTLRFKRAGLVIMGKGNVPELGLSIDTQTVSFGATHNPWNLDHSAGGSSGGSAAAVASRIVPAAHATDGGGSTRVPSSNCGLFGLKTSKGRVTYGPDVGEELIGMSTQHACTLSVRDSAALLDIDGVPDYGDPYWAPPAPKSYLALVDRDPRKLRIALSTRAPNGTPVHADCVAAANKAARLCESLGHVIEEAEPELNWNEGYAQAVSIVFGVGMYANVLAKARLKGEAVSERNFLPAIWKFLEIGRDTSSADYYIAVKRLHALSRQMARFHETYDVLLTPTMTTPPLRLTDFDYSAHGAENYLSHFWGVAAFMPLANASGQPAMTVPLHWNEQGLPVGAQFMARFGAEDLLLQLGAQLERASPWFDRMPAIAKPV
jgi:Asp-tRNA(Asn)/Glu-tRNA(Gln) amidotransferase A subunit family amidase